jgi:ABC-type sugar transport system ATPase subunit
MATITLDHVTKTFHPEDRTRGPVPVAGVRVAGGLLQEMVQPDRRSFTLEDLDLVLPDGQTTVVLGPSGCGKSSLLRLLAGFDRPDRGRLLFDGEDRTDSKPVDRKIGMVFQDYALYPDVKAETNVLGWFRFRKQTPEVAAEAREKLARTAALLGVETMALMGRMPGGLSGGERQRIALGRCITRDPALFLLDEPFSSLDASLRQRYRVDLKRLLGEFRITTVFVTHDQQEASLLADRLVILDRGRVIQTGTPADLTRSPANRFVAEFWNPDPLFPPVLWAEGGTVGVRPQDVAVGEGEGRKSVQGVVKGTETLALGNRRLARVQVGDLEWVFPLRTAEVPAAGTAVTLSLVRWCTFDTDGRLTGTHPRV